MKSEKSRDLACPNTKLRYGRKAQTGVGSKEKFHSFIKFHTLGYTGSFGCCNQLPTDLTLALKHSG